MRRFMTATAALALCLSAGFAAAQTSGAASGSNSSTVSGGSRASTSGSTAGQATPTPGSSMTAPSPSGSTASSSGAASSALSEPDVTFMKKAATSDMTEIETSKVALQKSGKPEVKQFAQQMIDDHTKLSATMKQLAAARGVQLPPRDPSIDAMVSKLNGLSGNQFDQEYLKGQVGGHRDASNLFHTEGAQAKDPQLKQAVATATPIIDQHLQHVQQLAASMGVEGKASLKK